MPKHETEGLSLEELKKYPGFEKATNEDLDEALNFIQLMTALLHSIN